jgi:hypothetical protein
VNSAEHVAIPAEAQERESLEEILRSTCFERTRGLRKLLQYLWIHREHDVSEYAIAVDALDRGANFDSKIDATVRVQIGRLRRQLDRYYESEGRGAKRRATIPLGSHRLQLVDAAPASEVENENDIAALTVVPQVPPPLRSANEPAKRIGFSVREISFAAAAAAVLACVVMTTAVLILTRVHPAVRAASSGNEGRPLFWRQFFDDGKPTRIVLPAPLFFAWSPKDSDSLMVRDISVNDFNHSKKSPELMNIEKRLGKPSPWQNYTVASDTFAALRLARFLDKYGIQTNFSTSEDSPHEITEHENIIAFGTTTSMVAFRPELDTLSFKMGPHERYIIDTRMPSGSPPPFRMIFEHKERAVMPGIVALLPRNSSGSRILLLQSEQTTALIAYLISDEGMRELSKALAGTRSPFFEAVVLSEVNGDNPIQNRLVAFRSVPSSPASIRTRSSVRVSAPAPETSQAPLSPTK